MVMEACGATHIGNVRKHNEDNIYVDGRYREDLSVDNVLIHSKRESGPYTYAVFDGLGGEAGGELASQIAAVALRAMEDRGAVREIDTYISTTHKTILLEAVRKDSANMGTTAVIVHIDGERAYISNIGDSRAYLYREGKLRQLSKDHNMYQSMLDGGFAAEAERIKEKSRNELTQYIGMPSDEDVEPSAYTAEADVKAGDIIMLCSDGLTAELSDEEITEVLGEEGRSAEYLAVRLIKNAIDRKGRDNVSAVVCIVKS